MPRNILVIEDDPDISELVSLHLRDYGHEVEVVGDGDLGLRRAMSGKFQLIILDLMLPGKNGLEINIENRVVIIGGAGVELTAKEFDLLAQFAAHPGKVYSRKQLLDLVWGYQHDDYEHTVNSHINRLRSKIEPDPTRPEYLLTVWGVGYKFNDAMKQRPGPGDRTPYTAIAQQSYQRHQQARPGFQFLLQPANRLDLAKAGNPLAQISSAQLVLMPLY